MSMQRFFVFLAVLACASTLAGCGSATDAVTFKAPANYTSAAQIGPFMQLWKGPQDNSLALMAFPAKIDLDKATTGSDIKNAQVIKHAMIRICGDQQAYYVSMIGEHADSGAAPGQKRLIDVLATDVNGKTYLAMYIRPVGTSADTAAEDAIRNVCSKS